MRDLVVLLVVVALVYLFQCICWAPAQAQVFLLEADEPSRRKRGFLWSALKLAGYWANPLPPLQPLLVVDWPEFQLTAEALRTVAETEPIPWEQVKLTRAGGKLLCNGVRIFQGGADQAKACEELLLRVKQAKAKDRQKMIAAWLRKATDLEAIKKRLELFDGKTRWLEFAVNLQFFLLFLVTPLAFFRFGSRALWPMLGAVVATSIFIVWRLWRGHKALFPADGDARFKSVFSALLSPIHAIRALDALTHDLLAGFHPVAVAGVICSAQEFEAFAGEQLRTMRFSQSGASWYAEQLRAALEKTVGKKGIPAQRLLAAPEREGECVQYCPRCRAQYTKEREECADCGFGPLAEFDQAPIRQEQQPQTVASGVPK
jgi:hypothetical protein